MDFPVAIRNSGGNSVAHLRPLDRSLLVGGLWGWVITPNARLGTRTPPLWTVTDRYEALRFIPAHPTDPEPSRAIPSLPERPRAGPRAKWCARVLPCVAPLSELRRQAREPWKSSLTAVVQPATNIREIGSECAATAPQREELEPVGSWNQ